MGRQIGFYMSKEDELAFLDFVKLTGDVTLLPYTSTRPYFQPVEVLPEPLSMDFWGDFWLFNRSVSSRLVTVYVPEQSYYVIDRDQSSVVEFSRSWIEGKTIYPGRIWAEFTFLDRKVSRSMPKEFAFKRWYETMAKWIRKYYTRVGGMLYSGPGAQKFRHEGGLLAVNLPVAKK